MNRADHRRLTPWLMLTAALLTASLLFFATGAGRHIHWLPAQEKQPKTVSAETLALPVTPPLDAYANTWKQPVFSPDRKPDQQMNTASEPQQLQGFTLTGVIVTNALQLALMKDSNGQAFSLTRGETLPNGWRLERVEPDNVLFTAGNRQHLLPLSIEKAPLGPVSEAPSATAVHPISPRQTPSK